MLWVQFLPGLPIFCVVSPLWSRRGDVLFIKNKEIKLAEKTNQQNAIARFYRETMGELRKVSWPTRAEAINLTIIVVIVLVLMAIILGTVDWLGFFGLDLILRQ